MLPPCCIKRDCWTTNSFQILMIWIYGEAVEGTVAAPRKGGGSGISLRGQWGALGRYELSFPHVRQINVNVSPWDKLWLQRTIVAAPLKQICSGWIRTWSGFGWYGWFQSWIANLILQSSQIPTRMKKTKWDRPGYLAISSSQLLGLLGLGWNVTGLLSTLNPICCLVENDL